jgi:hypothetical protein
MPGLRGQKCRPHKPKFVKFGGRDSPMHSVWSEADKCERLYRVVCLDAECVVRYSVDRAADRGAAIAGIRGQLTAYSGRIAKSA